MSAQKPRLLFIDAYDSFSESIIALLRDLLNVSVSVIEIDTNVKSQTGLDDEAFFLQFDAIVLGPGPGNPLNESDIGLYSAVWDIASQHSIPVLGICLGFQSLCAAYGMEISRLEMPCHGHAKRIHHEGHDMFTGAGEVIATCYNSLGVRAVERHSTPQVSRPPSRGSEDTSRNPSSRPSMDMEAAQSDEDAPLNTLAWDHDGWLQAVRHNTLPFWGLQFHPESCKSSSACQVILQTWFDQVKKCNYDKQIATESLETGSREQSTTETVSKPHKDLLSLLLSSSDVANGVQSKRLQLSLDRRQMADFCYHLSLQGRVSMLESSKKGRYSVYAISDASTWTLEYAGGSCHFIDSVSTRTLPVSLSNAMKVVEDFMQARLVLDGHEDSPFWGGLVGYFAYELGLDLLDINDPLDGPPAREVPDYSLMWVDRSIVVDKLQGTVYIQTVRPNDTDWIRSTATSLSRLSTSPPPQRTPEPTALTAHASLPDHAAYTAQITTCLAELHAGNSYELCLTTSAPLHLPSTSSPFHLHQQLLTSNPSTYSALLIHPSVSILSSSPEQFLTWARPTPSKPSSVLNMQPMKGTLAKTPGLTPAKASQLLRTPKEEAENLMIVDLIRHDLARALASSGAEGAKVTVEQLFALVEAETVFQLISHIQATVPASIAPKAGNDSTVAAPRSPLRQQRSNTIRHAFAALNHTLPPGSMTGAPKKRSCEILRSLERRNRGVYAGVIGYLDVGGSGACSVAIRCAFSPNGDEEAAAAGGRRKWHVGAGGAITVLSDVEGEWEEMRVKMGSVLRGFGVE